MPAQTPAKTLDFYFDVGSPTTYLAWTQLPRLQAATGAQLVFKPVLLGGIFKATGNGSPALVPAKGVHMLTDLARHARRYGVAFAPNPHFPINTLNLMRAITGMQLREPDRLDAFLRLVFEGLWVRSLNLNDPSAVAALLTGGGHDPLAVLALTEDPAVKEALKTTTAEAIARGAFGAPTFFVGEEMFFGQDRLDFVQEALGAA